MKNKLGLILLLFFISSHGYCNEDFSFYCRIYKIETNLNEGTAFLYKIEKSGNENWGYFFTCYHVTYGGSYIKLRPYSINTEKKPSLQDFEKIPYLKIPNKKDLEESQLYCIPEYDMCIIKCKMLSSWAKELDNVSFVNYQDLQNIIPLEVKCVGFPWYQYEVAICNVTLSGKYKKPFNKEKDTLIFSMQGDMVSKGMSGGPVLTKDNQFVGIVFGKILDESNLAISVDNIENLLKKAVYKNFSSRLLQVSPIIDNPEVHLQNVPKIKLKSASFRRGIQIYLDINDQDKEYVEKVVYSIKQNKQGRDKFIQRWGNDKDNFSLKFKQEYESIDVEIRLKSGVIIKHKF